jgi:two-component system cell cycle sensor histidine kinase/response regulator CckA
MDPVADLALAADELPVAIWMGRVPSGEVVYTNAAFREVLGIEPPEGAARGAFVAPYGVHTTSGEPYPESEMPFERVLRARALVVIDDLVIHRRDGRRVSLRVFAKPLFDADGNMTHVLEAFTDITREVEAELARAEGDRRLARAQRQQAIGQLVAGIAHDFNNLLTVTKLAVSSLRSREKDAAKLATIDQVASVTDSAIQLIRNLISFARRERQVAAPIRLESAVQPVLAIAARTFDRSIELRSSFEVPEAMVVGDPSQLEQVVMNLVINARDAIADTGEVLVRTRARVVPESDAESLAPGPHVVLEVIDTGAGIAPAIRDRIFEPYFTTKTKGAIKGTGLGLSTVQGIVHALGGTIDVEDNAPRGTIMRVTLPRAADEPRRVASEPPAPTMATAAASEAEPRPSGERPLVLVIDDEPLVRAWTVTTLEARGFRVLDAADGAAGIALFGAHQHEIAGVVLDMVMPGMRGREVFLELREIRADVRVLLVSGCALDVEAEDILALGVGGWLPKPYDAQQLATGLEQAGVR